VLLAKTLRSSTFKLALIAIATFGVIASAIFSYVYLSTSSFVRSRSDRAITVEYSSLLDAYERRGRDGLIDIIRQRMADKVLADYVYVLADPSSAVLAGNLKEWPPAVTAASGWTEFRAEPSLPDAISALVNEGHRSITIAPIFMAQGGHLKNDLPKILNAIRAEHKETHIRLLPPIGEVEPVLNAISEWLLGVSAS